MTPHAKLEIRRMLLAAVVEPKRVMFHGQAGISTLRPVDDEQLREDELMVASRRELVEVGEPQPDFVRCTIVYEGTTPVGHADAAIRLSAAVEAEAAALGLSPRDVIRTLAVVMLRAAAMHDDSKEPR